MQSDFQKVSLINLICSYSLGVQEMAEVCGAKACHICCLVQQSEGTESVNCKYSIKLPSKRECEACTTKTCLQCTWHSYAYDWQTCL